MNDKIFLPLYFSMGNTIKETDFVTRLQYLHLFRNTGPSKFKLCLRKNNLRVNLHIKNLSWKILTLNQLNLFHLCLIRLLKKLIGKLTASWTLASSKGSSQRPTISLCHGLFLTITMETSSFNQTMFGLQLAFSCLNTSIKMLKNSDIILYPMKEKWSSLFGKR